MRRRATATRSRLTQRRRAIGIKHPKRKPLLWSDQKQRRQDKAIRAKDAAWERRLKGL